MVFDGKLGVMVSWSGRIWEFFHDEGKVSLEKDEFMRTVRCGMIKGADNLNMDLDMWSGPVLSV